MASKFQITLPGVSIGHAHDAKVNTGTTALLFDQPATCAMAILGGAPGTRDTELLNPQHTVDQVDALVLSGGSAYGLDAASGAQAWLKEHNRGIHLDPVRIPIVPCAILFDMRNDGDKTWGKFSPYAELGYQAMQHLTAEPALGRQGCAYGAATANTPGGFGMAYATVQQANGESGQVLACAAVNAVGSPMIGDTNHFWAAPFEVEAEFGGRGLPSPWPEDAKEGRTKSGQRVAGANTTLGVVVTDLNLTAAQAQRLATASHDGFTRALYPVHTPADGDLIFAASTAQKEVTDEGLFELGVVAGNAMARAIARGVYEAMQT